MVPVAFKASIDAPPTIELTETGFPAESYAKLLGAEIVEPLVVHVEASSSAMKASLNGPPVNSGNCSVRNLKSKVRQLAVGCAIRSILKTVASKSEFPRS